MLEVVKKRAKVDERDGMGSGRESDAVVGEEDEGVVLPDEFL